NDCSGARLDSNPNTHSYLFLSRRNSRNAGEAVVGSGAKAAASLCHRVIARPGEGASQHPERSATRTRSWNSRATEELVQSASARAPWGSALEPGALGGLHG